MVRLFYILLIIIACVQSYGQTSEIDICEESDNHNHAISISLYFQTEGISSYIDEEDIDLFAGQGTEKITSLLEVDHFLNYTCLTGYAYVLIRNILLPNHLDLPPPLT
jgi:hypothetical protein